MKNYLNKTVAILGFASILFSASAMAQLAMPSAASSPQAMNSSSDSASFREDVDYRVLPVRQAVESKGKVEITEFFWYGCPHCFEFDPELQAWLKKQGKDVVFKRVPIAFRDDFLPHSQMYYAFEALGKGDVYTSQVMNAIHVQHKQLLKEADIAEWAATQKGLDAKAFMAAFNSFSVITKAKAANSIGTAYRIDGVPTLAVQGKYVTSPSIAGTKARALETMDFLVSKARREKLN